jgi:hypothetical protein
LQQKPQPEQKQPERMQPERMQPERMQPERMQQQERMRQQTGCSYCKQTRLQPAGQQRGATVSFFLYLWR